MELEFFSECFAVIVVIAIASLIFISLYNKKDIAICPRCGKLIKHPTDTCPGCKLKLAVNEEEKENGDEET